jgi:hypothetical protein
MYTHPKTVLYVFSSNPVLYLFSSNPVLFQQGTDEDGSDFVDVQYEITSHSKRTHSTIFDLSIDRVGRYVLKCISDLSTAVSPVAGNNVDDATAPTTAPTSGASGVTENGTNTNTSSPTSAPTPASTAGQTPAPADKLLARCARAPSSVLTNRVKQFSQTLLRPFLWGGSAAIISFVPDDPLVADTPAWVCPVGQQAQFVAPNFTGSTADYGYGDEGPANQTVWQSSRGCR